MPSGPIIRETYRNLEVGGPESTEAILRNVLGSPAFQVAFRDKVGVNKGRKRKAERVRAELAREAEWLLSSLYLMDNGYLLGIARHPSGLTAELLSYHKYPGIRKAVASSSSSDLETIARLMREDHLQEVRDSARLNLEKMLERLLRGREFLARYPKLPPENSERNEKEIRKLEEALYGLRLS